MLRRQVTFSSSTLVLLGEPLCCNTLNYMKAKAERDNLEAKPTPVRLRPDQRPKVEAIMKKDDRDLSWIMRKALDEYIERRSKRK